VKVAHDLGGVTRDPASVVTVGTFDGVHRAHREIIGEVVARAGRRGGRSVVVTFDPHPRQVVGDGRNPVRLLTTLAERVDLIGALGIDVLVLLRFTTEFSRQTPREFFERYIVNGTGVGEVVVGYDHMFGRDRQAGIKELEALGKEFHFDLFTLQPFMLDGRAVSSTAVRAALSAGEVERAAGLLGYPYAISGVVTRGDGRGRTIGFPTANIVPSDSSKLIPGNGVYVVGFQVHGVDRMGMANIGVRPTVSTSGTVVIEVHVLDFDGDLYDAPVTVTFLHRLREERKFASIDELAEQLRRDRESSREMLEQRQQ
jgi:riboflavin kinase/FMN adenylyltransferase